MGRLGSIRVRSKSSRKIRKHQNLSLRRSRAILLTRNSDTCVSYLTRIYFRKKSLNNLLIFCLHNWVTCRMCEVWQLSIWSKVLLFLNYNQKYQEMIDLLKNYKELKNAPGYAGSLRYYLAKKKLDVSIPPVRLSSSSGCSLTNKLWNNS